jgi:hypothetical protein
MQELPVDEDTNEITIISLSDLLFQSLRDSLGDISEFHILYHIAGTYAALNEILMDGAIVEMSKTKIIRTLDSSFVEIRTVWLIALRNRPPTGGHCLTTYITRPT